MKMKKIIRIKETSFVKIESLAYLSNLFIFIIKRNVTKYQIQVDPV